MHADRGLFANAPDAVAVDPGIIPVREEPTQPEFADVRPDPWRLRVLPDPMSCSGEGEVLGRHR